jgi:hypothetical protein
VTAVTAGRKALTTIADGVANGRMVVVEGIARLALTEAPGPIAAPLRDHLVAPQAQEN